ncbi:hypothetical protein SAMN04515674_12166 [Pseudarcicella hirudinis]|uniref:DUF1320 domain-containing protein n=1 Tax=Pseudarcicella hirudinis TaxID=1079859 RepID=A0A1I5X5J2_9BACT|nr:hypothetical protein [Pseudarcicella hirudinis]SFQ27275.1 hypothetical protein SAMN04515674_113152 [Pseudarcicella hirudinis]SFQ47636.1 hypothetical protein SAMN04515674_12166 [Pseudarcicella hirudinis]
MSFITREEFSTHVYEEAQYVISRGDNAKIDQAISMGLQVLARYLTAYDTQSIFATTGTDRDKYQELITYTKDISKWHFIAVCNVSVDLELAEKRYQFAIKELERIQKSSIVQGWPLAQNNQDPKPFRSGSGRKFNHF